MTHRRIGILFQNTKTKVINITTSLVVVASSLGGALPVLLSQNVYAAGNAVTPAALDGWAPQDGTPSIVAGPTGADGVGSLKLITTDSQAKQNYFHAASTALDGISGLGYKLDVAASVPASYQLQITGAARLDHPSNGSTFTSLIWEPVYNGQSNGPNGGFTSETNLESGTWWSSNSIAGAPNRSTFVPLSTIIAQNPGAQIVAYGVNVGGGTPGATSYVDDVSFQSSVTDFEPTPVLGAENFNPVNDSSYKGISVGFNAKDFSDVSAITVTLTRSDGTTAVMHGTQALFDLIDTNTAPNQFTAPFVIQPGSYTGDAYWTSDAATWNTKTVPKSVTITVTGANGTQTVTNSTFNQGAPSWPVYTSLVPTDAPTNLKFNYKDANEADQTLACGNGINSNKPKVWHENGSLNLNWSAPSGNITGYQVQVTGPTGTYINYGGPNEAYSWIQFPQGQGKYTYQVRTSSDAGASDYSPSCVLYYDAQGPTAHFVKAPDDGARINGSITIEANGQDNVALKSLLVDVRSEDGKTSKASCSGTPDYSTDRKTATLTCTVNTDKLVDGTTYMLRTHASDFSGYGSVITDAVRYITIDRQLPSATITSPSGVVKGKVLTIKGSATDNADFNYYYCYVTLPGSSEVGVRGADCNTTWHSATNSTLGTVDLSGLADGSYEAHLVAYDKAGNHSDLNYAVPFTLDNTRPTLAFTAPVDFSTPFKAGPTVSIHGSDANGLSALVIHVYNSANVLQTQACSATAAELTSGNLSCNLSTLSDGTYYVKAGSNDKAGNNQTIQSPNFTIDSQRPNASITSPDNGSFVTGHFTVSGTATDAQTSVDHVNVYVTKLKSDGSFGGYVVNNQPATYDPITHVFSYDVEGLSEGDYTVKSVAFDQAGNSHFANTVTVTVDTTAPSALAANPPAGTYTSGQLVNLSSTDASGIPVVYYTTDNSVPSKSNGTLYTGAGFTVNSSETVKAIAYDAAGNASPVMTAAYVIVPATNFQINSGRGAGPSNLQTHVTQLAVQSATLSNTSVGQVLGDSTTEPSTPTTNAKDNGKVKGASTTAQVEGASSKTSRKFLGLGWWWLAILALIALVIFALLRRADSDAKTGA